MYRAVTQWDLQVSSIATNAISVKACYDLRNFRCFQKLPFWNPLMFCRFAVGILVVAFRIVVINVVFNNQRFDPNTFILESTYAMFYSMQTYLNGMLFTFITINKYNFNWIRIRYTLSLLSWHFRDAYLSSSYFTSLILVRSMLLNQQNIFKYYVADILSDTRYPTHLIVSNAIC